MLPVSCKKQIKDQIRESSNNQMQNHFRYVPFVRNLKIRVIIGFFLLVLSATLAKTIYSKGRIEVIVSITAAAWMLAVLFTDKYVHKYPQRYFTYLFASHSKAAIVMAFFLWIICRLAGPVTAPQDVLWIGYLFFICADVIASIPYHRDIAEKQSHAVSPTMGVENIIDNRSTHADYLKLASALIDKQTILRKIHFDLERSFLDFIENNLPDFQGGTGDVLVLDDLTTTDNKSKPASVGLLIGRTRINDVLRLNQFMQFCTEHINLGGYFVLRYMPFENVLKNLKDRYSGPFYWIAFILHFIWYRAIPKIPWLDKLYFSPIISWLDTIHLSLVKKRNRVLSKAEVWGRLSFYGMRVHAESKGDGELYIIAQRITFPVLNKIPSYYPIASLEKVGLDGEIIRTHKIRTMFPFSEFLQQRVFEDHGLAPTGKFTNDFRLTEYGRFLRKYWLDELPQIFDWLRGDIKLVGMRATSRQFLSLYPKEFYNLYIQIKPGLIPPIFDESIKGFDQIVEVELTYLQHYWEQPIWTDIRYFFQTFTDIVFRGVRSK